MAGLRLGSYERTLVSKKDGEVYQTEEPES